MKPKTVKSPPAERRVEPLVGRCCVDCVFWELSNEDDGEKDGICHRYPPVKVSGSPDDEMLDDDGKWLGRESHSFINWTQPRVLETDWCGEFVAVK